jgi:hypothetical protein
MSKLKENLTLVGVGLSAIVLLILPTWLAGLLVIIGCGLAVVWDNYTRMGNSRNHIHKIMAVA